MTYNKTFAALLATATLVPTIALAGISVGDTIGSTEAEIRTHLEKQGYKIEEIEIESDEIEVEASLNGLMLEIEISPEKGVVVAIEAEDDDDDDDDDDEGEGEGEDADKKDG